MGWEYNNLSVVTSFLNNWVVAPVQVVLSDIHRFMNEMVS